MNIQIAVSALIFTYSTQVSCYNISIETSLHAILKAICAGVCFWVWDQRQLRMSSFSCTWYLHFRNSLCTSRLANYFPGNSAFLLPKGLISSDCLVNQVFLTRTSEIACSLHTRRLANYFPGNSVFLLPKGLVSTFTSSLSNNPKL